MVIIYALINEINEVSVYVQETSPIVLHHFICIILIESLQIHIVVDIIVTVKQLFLFYSEEVYHQGLDFSLHDSFSSSKHLDAHSF